MVDRVAACWDTALIMILFFGNLSFVYTSSFEVLIKFSFAFIKKTCETLFSIPGRNYFSIRLNLFFIFLFQNVPK